MADEPQEKSVTRVRGAVIMRDQGRVLPGSAPPAMGRKGTVNKIRSDFKAEYAAYCELMGPRANLLLFYESVRINDELPIDIRLKAADALSRIVFPAAALVAWEKPTVSKEMADRGAKLADALKSAFTSDLPMLEAPRG